MPRDLMIAMMYGRAFALYLEDGRIIRSMASRNDVSSSLDMISHTPGQTLVRGEKYWEGRQQTTGNHKAMMTVKADRTGQNYDAGAVISFDEATYDQGGWTNFPTVKDRFTVPEGTNYVQCTGQVGVRALAAGVPVLLQLVKNGVGAFPGRIIGRENINTTTRFATFTSPPVPCVPGDEFTLYLQTNGDTSITLLADWTYLSILTV